MNKICFEFWILLHIKYTSKTFSSTQELLKQLKIDCKSLMNQKKRPVSLSIYKILATQDLKNTVFEHLGSFYSLFDLTKALTEDAMKNAKKLRSEQKKIIKYSKGQNLDTLLRLNANPYTEMDILIQSLYEIAELS